MNNINCYDINGNAIRSLFQWDLGITVELRNIVASETTEIHFCNRLSKEALRVPVTMSEAGVIAEIPNVLLTQAETIVGYTYNCSDISTCQTKNVFYIPVLAKPKPSEYQYIENIEVTSVAKIEREIQDKFAEIDEKLSVVASGSPKGGFSSQDELSGKEAGIYVNSTDGWVYYWDGQSLSEGICLYQATEIGDGTIPPEKLDRKYWEHPSYEGFVFDEYMDLVDHLVNEDRITVAEFNLITGEGVISGICHVIAKVEDSGAVDWYIANLTTGEFWTIRKEAEGNSFTAQKLTKKLDSCIAQIEQIKEGKVNADLSSYAGLSPVADEDKLVYQSAEENALKSISFDDFKKSLDYVCIALNSFEELYKTSFAMNKKYLIKCSGSLAGEFSTNYCEATFVSSSLGEILTVVPVGNIYEYYVVDLEDETCTCYSREAADGYSPTATVEQTDNGATITITDKDGTTTATVVNGKDGADGKSGKDGYTPIKGVDYFDGVDGKDGTNGKDGVSASHSWNGTTLTVTSASGTSSADLKGAKGDKGDKGDTGSQGIQGVQGEKGATGEKGADGYSPVKGVDYFTEEDKTDIVEQVTTQMLSLSNSPDFIVSEAQRVAEQVQSVRSAKTLVFSIMSDFHLYADNSAHDNTLLSLQYASMGIDEINKRIHTDFTALLGDYSYMSVQDYTVGQVKKDMILAKKTLGSFGNKELWSVGNHDLNYGAGRNRLLTNDEIYAYVGANSDGVKHFENIERGYGYLDFENHKIRVINLNTCDVSDWATTDGVTARSEWISPTQMEWLINTALDFSDKTNVSEWGIIIIGHHPLHYAYKCYGQTMEILEAYRDGTSGTVSPVINDTTYTVNFDFSSLEERAEIICNIHGHNHNCGASKISSTSWAPSLEQKTPWLWRFCIPNICANRYNEAATNSNENFKNNYGEFDGSGNPVYWTKETGTAKATSFCVVSINRTLKKIYAHIFGAGKDRVFSYEEEYIPQEYSITTTLSQCVGSTNNPATITEDGSATLTFTANEGYKLPESISVVGASYTWDNTTGTLVLSYAIGDVSISIFAESRDVLKLMSRAYAEMSSANGDPQFIATTDTRELDTTKYYASIADGRGGYYPCTKITEHTIISDSSLSLKVSSSNGYGLEFPVSLEASKTYLFTRTADITGGMTYLKKYNPDTTYNNKSELGSVASGSYSAEIIPEEGYIYSIFFVPINSGNVNQLITFTDISLTEKD